MTFLGALDDVASIMHHFNLMVLSSRSEGTPMVILESLGAGLPVVATAVGGVPDVVRAGQDRWLVPPEDAGALSTAMEEALADRTKRERRGAAGQARVRDEFDVEPWAAGHQQLYSEAIIRRASPDRGAET